MPPDFAMAEVIPEPPVRMFAAWCPGLKVPALRMVFEERKLAKPDDGRLVAAAKSLIEQAKQSVSAVS
jgi:hypothetical protein